MPKRRPTPKRKRWTPLQRTRAVSNAEHYVKHGLSMPDAVFVNDLYSVFVRTIPTDYAGEELPADQGALHISFHRHDREAVRDWRHFQAIKNEVAGPERTAVEVFPPESQLVDSANEYHLWVLPVGFPLPFVMTEQLVMTHAEGQAFTGRSKSRQRDWQPGIPTGKGLDA